MFLQPSRTIIQDVTYPLPRLGPARQRHKDGFEQASPLSEFAICCVLFNYV